MSIEIETTEVAPPNGELAPQPLAANGSRRHPIWRYRRYQLIALFAAVAFVAALIGNNLLARQYTADGAVRQYLSALQAGDSTKAWAAIQVTAPTASVTATVTDRNALQAALAVGKPDIKNFAVTHTSQLDAKTTSVDVTYDTPSGSKQAKFMVQRSGQTSFGIYPLWHLVISPTILQITLPKGSPGVSLDSKAIALPDGQSTIAVLPIPHRLEVNGTAMLASQTISVDGFGSPALSVSYQPKLTSAGTDKAKAALKAAFATCALQTGAYASSGGRCPQDAGLNQDASGQWRLIGDPTRDMTVGFDQDLNVAALGHYQMVFTYQYHGTQHLAAAGGYVVSLAVAGTEVTVGSIGNTRDAPVLQRPAGATDQAVKDLVTQGFAQCAKSSADLTADCPQQLIDLEVSNISWSMTGDPLVGATISFDSGTGLITVRGNLPMTASYRSVGTARNKASFTRSYEASLLWDGQGLQLVTIAGVI